MGLGEVRAAPARTQQGTAAVRIIEVFSPAGGGSDITEGHWDFDRRQGTFRSPDGTALVVANGAEFLEVSAADRADQAGDDPGYRYAWSQRTVQTTDDVDDDGYFGLAAQSAATFWHAFALLDRATAASDLGAARIGRAAARHLRVQIPLPPGGGEPPEVWLDGEGRIRRLRLSTGDRIHFTLVVELSRFGAAVEVNVPPADQLNASAAAVPMAPWRTVRTGQQAGRQWRVRMSPSNVEQVTPPATGACLALEVEPFPQAETPPTWFDCKRPGPVVVHRTVPPELRSQVLVGTAEPPRPTVAVGLVDGTTGAADVVDGVFVLFTDGRPVHDVDGEPLS